MTFFLNLAHSSIEIANIASNISIWAHLGSCWLMDKTNENKALTRKYPLRGYILGVLTHTTAWDRLWGGEQRLNLVLNLLFNHSIVLKWYILLICTKSKNFTVMYVIKKTLKCCVVTGYAIKSFESWYLDKGKPRLTQIPTIWIRTTRFSKFLDSSDNAI